MELCRSGVSGGVSEVSVFEGVLVIFEKSFETGKNSNSGKQLK